MQGLGCNGLTEANTETDGDGQCFLATKPVSFPMMQRLGLSFSNVSALDFYDLIDQDYNEFLNNQIKNQLQDLRKKNQNQAKLNSKAQYEQEKTEYTDFNQETDISPAENLGASCGSSLKNLILTKLRIQSLVGQTDQSY